MFGSEKFEIKKIERKSERKEKIINKKINKNKFKINKLFLYHSLNLFHLIFSIKVNFLK